MIFALVLLTALVLPRPYAPSAQAAGAITFAAIGDYGSGSSNETAVANLVKGWNPAFVIALGDDYYNAAGGSGSTKYDNSTGKNYCSFLAGIATSGTNCPQPGSSGTNRFFPALGNHDYSDAGTTNSLPTTYTSYFALPGAGVTSPNPTGNERYYDFVQGPVHFFVINSNSGSGQEPNGTSSTSAQATWLKNALAASTSTWNIVYFHHPPYSSGSTHGSSTYMRWPFAQWGADAVLSGHDHDYERLVEDGIPYFVNGLGGDSLYSFGTPLAGSQYRFSGSYGAQRITASDTSLTFDFITTDGTLRDTQTLTAGGTAPTPTNTPLATATSAPNPTATPTKAPVATATPTSGGTTLTLAPTADSYVESANPSANYGTQTQLRDDASPITNSYLRFDTSTVTGKITRATLRLYANSSHGVGYDVHSLSSPTASWTETGITYSNAPAIASTVAGSSGPFSTGAWTSVDVTGLVGAGGVVNLALTTTSSTAMSLGSREDGTHAPQLVIQLGSTTSATPVPTATTAPAPSTPTATATATTSTVHVGDLGATSVATQGSHWHAVVTITAHNGSHAPKAGATVSGTWSTGGTATCTTDSTGKCSVTSADVTRATTSVTFTVGSVTASGATYQASANHDPDGDSNGTTITVARP